MPDEDFNAGDTCGDQHYVGHRAERDYGQNVLAADALAQHEGVLRTDRCDQGERGDEAEDQGRAHAFTVGTLGVSVKLMILQMH